MHLKATGMNLTAAYPREEQHQFLLGLYGEYILLATIYAATLYATSTKNLVLGAHSKEALQPGSRYTTRCLDSLGTSFSAAPDLVTDHQMFGPRGAEIHI
jgi:hypothetical protein